MEYDLAARNKWILEMKVEFLFSNAAFTNFASAIVLLAFCYAQWEIVIGNGVYVAWVVGTALLIVTRYIHLVFFKRKGSDANYMAWLNSYRFLIFLSSLSYSLMVFLFFDAVNAAFQLFIGFIIVAMTSSAVATHGIDKLTFRLFSLPIVLSATLFLALHEVNEYNLMAALMILLVIALERTSTQTSSIMTNNFELTYSMKYRATHDLLVGLYNRGELESQFEQRIVDSRHGVALMFIDLDNFKPLNDSHGHEAGDEALIAVANVLRTRIRNDDLAARLGGDEFVILLSLDDISIAEQIADNIRSEIASLFIADKRMEKLSCSIGLVFKKDSQIGFSRLLREADLGCYDSKAHGKNKVSVRVVE